MIRAPNGAGGILNLRINRVSILINFGFEPEDRKHRHDDRVDERISEVRTRAVPKKFFFQGSKGNVVESTGVSSRREEGKTVPSAEPENKKARICGRWRLSFFSDQEAIGNKLFWLGILRWVMG